VFLIIITELVLQLRYLLEFGSRTKHVSLSITNVVSIVYCTTVRCIVVVELETIQRIVNETVQRTDHAVQFISIELLMCCGSFRSVAIVKYSWTFIHRQHIDHVKCLCNKVEQREIMHLKCLPTTMQC